ncbi:aminotransferase class IV [Candidatus Merdisoma sp. JLR.KK011]|jgi:branched-chain amino acid aminotransferase|uniref:aminotransferase class IV n=1 Tax=Candidatus Merdisoma sp. JLR.KK011 TaxID=3114299 RepID=UPI002FF139FC
MRKVYYNGEFVDEARACISVYDSALMFGDMVFEMTRSFHKEQFKLREHIERLYASAKYLRIDLEEAMSKEQMEAAIKETIRINEGEFQEDDEHRIMIDVTRGLLSIYEGVVGTHKGLNIIIADFPLRWTVRGMGELFDKGINAVIPSQRAIPASLIDPKVKNRSRIHYLMANMQVSNYEGSRNWALLLDTDNHVAEGTGDNFFIVKNGILLTPEPRNILRGISREYVFEIAKDLGIEYQECNLDVYDVVNADEAFMTGTPFCILPVTTIDGQRIGTGRPGPVFKRLIDKWGANVNLDIIKQIKAWNACEDPSEITVSPYSFKK